MQPCSQIKGKSIKKHTHGISFFVFYVVWPDCDKNTTHEYDDEVGKLKKVVQRCHTRLIFQSSSNMLPLSCSIIGIAIIYF